MPIKNIKPTTNARRQLTYLSFSGVDKVKPEKSLVVGKQRVSGRNSAGQIVTYSRGGGAKRRFRLVDLSLIKHMGERAEVISIEYDPNRTANISLIQFEDGEKVYILAPEGLKKGATLTFGENAPIKIGNRLKLRNIPVATQIHNIGMTLGKGGQICRSAGTFATLIGTDEKYAQVRMPSGEVRKILTDNFASIGIVSNLDHSKVVIGKAGRSRMLGRRPTVLGKSKNAVDHPHGGGEGHSPIGIKKGPKTPWGALALGPRTRNKKKPSQKLVLSRRKK